MRILFLSASLESGGAERQIAALAPGLRRRGHRVSVAVLYGGGPFADALRSQDVPIHELRRRGRWDLRFLPRLARLVRSERPDVILPYLGGPNIYSAALKPLFPSLKVVWGVRSAALDVSGRDWLTRIGPRVESVVSVLADAVVANSDAAGRAAVARGISGRKVIVIPNGIDCELFRPDSEGRQRLRRAWSVGPETRVVGMVARLDPVKNHATFLRAAARVANARGDAHFVCVGRGGGPYLRELERLVQELGLTDRLTWAGEQSVGSAIYSALDVAVLASDSESFPNVVAEAMACGTPVVATNTGDLPLIIGDTGVLVPPRDPLALAEGILATLERAPAGERGRRERTRGRIEREYSMDMLVSRTERALQRIVTGD